MIINIVGGVRMVGFGGQRKHITYLSKWWHTINISKCSSIVLAVYGRVGFVDDGSTFFSLQTLMMSGAWPPPAPSEWYVWIVRPANDSMVSSTHADSFSVSVWMVTCKISYTNSSKWIQLCTIKYVCKSDVTDKRKKKSFILFMRSAFSFQKNCHTLKM